MFKTYPEEFYTDLSSNSVKNPLLVIKCVSEYMNMVVNILEFSHIVNTSKQPVPWAPYNSGTW